MNGIVGILIFFLALTWGCADDVHEIEYGVQPDHSSFVPARIAVLKCRNWPAGARFKSLPLSNFTPEELKGLCKEFDQFVLKGFESQPYMRGLSPRAVERVLGPEFLMRIDREWRHLPEDCQFCGGPPSFYAESVAVRADWRTWLGQLSRNTKNADAVLMPFLTHGFQRSWNDRGILLTERVAGITALLIDTNNGNLLWAGGRSAVASNQKLADKPTTENPSPPEWKMLHRRLFTQDVWKEFPGRQVYH